MEYGSAEEFYPARIKIEKLAGETKSGEAKTVAEPKKSPHGTRWFVLEEPDYTQQPQWNTSLTVYGNPTSGPLLRVTFLDHASYGVQPMWVSEKLLFIRAWWGRIEATELLLDVETGKPVTIENANFVEFTGPCQGDEAPR